MSVRKKPDAAEYEKIKKRAAERSAEASREGRDIGEMPAVVDPARKDACWLDFEKFALAYFPELFLLPFSQDHKKAIARIQQSVLQGGLFAFAMPRGTGKSTLSEIACLWAMLYGHRSFVCLIGSDEGHAGDMLSSIKLELETNERLGEDFPEVCFPIRALEGIANRCRGQLYQGQRTHIGWTADEIVLPTIAGSQASGAVVRVAGITGRIRGMKHKRVDGRTVRPDLAVIDDPQTDESARSLSQCVTREKTLAGAVLGLAGPGKKIAGIMPCTVIRPGDMADAILDREKHPEWNGERTKLVYAFPTNEALWKQYAEIRADGLRADDGGRAATEFYRKHRAEMDAGAVVAWPERFNHDELSAIQHAMNLRLQDEAAFWAEYQNSPLAEVADDDTLGPDEIAKKFNGYDRAEVPTRAQKITAMIDVHGALLYYAVVAWSEDFSGYVIDYGSYPDQRRDYYTLREASPALDLSIGGPEAAIYSGLDALCASILGRVWRTDDDSELRVERCMVDANWGEMTDVVYQFCRQSVWSSVMLPSHGKYVGASSQPFSEYKRKQGDRIGQNWRIPSVAGKRAVRHVLFDTNFWKSFVHARLAVPMGGTGCLSLFGKSAREHRLIADHCTAEYRVKTQGRGRNVDEWKLRPEKPDNHLFDCLVGATVAASIQGVVLGGDAPAPNKKPRMSYAELRARRGQ